MPPCVAVIGGGISGLAAAHRVRELDPCTEVMLLEAGQRLGGVLQTTQEAGFLYESAADSFLTAPSTAVELCHRLGLDDELIAPARTGRQALVVRKGRLVPVPVGFHLMAPRQLWPLLSSRVLSLRGKLRAAAEYFIPGRTGQEDESLQSFVCRRFGRELFERLVQPLVSGIYTGDPQQLSIEATFPRFRQMEREHGSLTRAMLRSRRDRQEHVATGARYGQFATLRGGMSRLVTALADRLPRNTVQLASPVTGLSPIGDAGWQLQLGGGRRRTLRANGVIVATPAHRSACLLRGIDADLADELQGIRYASCAVVGLGYRRDQIKHPLNGFGFVVPLVEQRLILACSFSSVKYSGRAPRGSVLLRVFLGGDCQQSLLRLSHGGLGEVAEREVSDLLRIRGKPTWQQTMIHEHKMPQYHVDHRQRVTRIDARMKRFPALTLAGNALHGLGVPSCIRAGESAAADIVAQVKKHRTGSLPPIPCTPEESLP